MGFLIAFGGEICILFFFCWIICTVGMWVYHIWRFFRSIGIGTFNLWMHPRMYPVHDAIEYVLLFAGLCYVWWWGVNYFLPQ